MLVTSALIYGMRGMVKWLHSQYDAHANFRNIYM